MNTHSRPPAKSKQIALRAGIGAILLCAGILAYGPFDEWRYRPTATFDVLRWNKPDMKYRYSALPVVIREIIKPGMTEEQVTALLGAPNAITADEDWQYETQQPGWKIANWTGGGLLIRFDRDRHVVEAVDNTLVD
jgi:hypothetical protein